MSTFQIDLVCEIGEIVAYWQLARKLALIIELLVPPHSPRVFTSLELLGSALVMPVCEGIRCFCEAFVLWGRTAIFHISTAGISTARLEGCV